MITVIGGIKGGCGKSTTLTHLATASAVQGRRVLIVDTDSQGSLMSWAEARAATAETTTANPWTRGGRPRMR